MQAATTESLARPFGPASWDEIEPVVKEDVSVERTKETLTVTRTRTETRTTVDGVTSTNNQTDTNTFSLSVAQKQPYLKAAAIAVTGVAVAIGVPVALSLGVVAAGVVVVTSLAATAGALFGLKRSSDARFARLSSAAEPIREELFKAVQGAGKALTLADASALVVAAQQKLALIKA